MSVEDLLINLSELKAFQDNVSEESYKKALMSQIKKLEDEIRKRGGNI